MMMMMIKKETVKTGSEVFSVKESIAAKKKNVNVSVWKGCVNKGSETLLETEIETETGQAHEFHVPGHDLLLRPHHGQEKGHDPEK